MMPKWAQEYRLPVHPSKMHDVLASAACLVSDSQTMTAEAAVLGTPAIRYNTFVGRLSYLNELENRYALTYGYRPGQEEAMLARIAELLASPDLSQEWQARRAKMLRDKINVTDWMVDFLLSYQESHCHESL